MLYAESKLWGRRHIAMASTSRGLSRSTRGACKSGGRRPRGTTACAQSKPDAEAAGRAATLAWRRLGTATMPQPNRVLGPRTGYTRPQACNKSRARRPRAAQGSQGKHSNAAGGRSLELTPAMHAQCVPSPPREQHKKRARVPPSEAYGHTTDNEQDDTHTCTGRKLVIS